jgi:hypothetical protein
MGILDRIGDGGRLMYLGGNSIDGLRGGYLAASGGSPPA